MGDLHSLYGIKHSMFAAHQIKDCTTRIFTQHLIDHLEREPLEAMVKNTARRLGPHTSFSMPLCPAVSVALVADEAERVLDCYVEQRLGAHFLVVVDSHQDDYKDAPVTYSVSLCILSLARVRRDAKENAVEHDEQPVDMYGHLSGEPQRHIDLHGPIALRDVI